MNNKEDAPSSDAAGGAGGVPQSVGRRRLLRGGLGAAPVVLTFVSQPAPALNFTSCLSASATMSLQAGLHSNGIAIAGGSPGCQGLGPAAWATTAFPAGYTTASPFADNFPGYTSGTTLGQILTTDKVVGNAQSQLRRNLVAALLNIQSNKLSGSVVTLSTLINIWNGLKTGGSGTWDVRPGAPWDLAKTTTWFGTLFTAADA